MREANANAVHALLHAMFEDGSVEDADALVDRWIPTYDRSGILHGHIRWHQALGALEHGDAARALNAFADEDYAACVAHLEPVLDEVVRIGGSHAQRELIEDTFIVALIKSGELPRARAMLDRRLHRRPSPRDVRWQMAAAE